GSTVRLVADDPFDTFPLPDGVEQISEPEAIELVGENSGDSPTDQDASMLHRRTGRWESWPSTSFVLIGEAHDERWDQIAALPSIVVLSTTHRFESGLDVSIRNGTISIPSLGIEQPAGVMTEMQQMTIDDVMESVGVEAAEEVAAEPEPSVPAENPVPVEMAEDWQPPRWPVMINVLGAPHAAKNGVPIKLTPQQLSALALIAMKREIPAHDFRRSIWGDEDDVSPERVRDMLSQLRKKVGGLRVIPKREDGLVCAGEDLGSDTLIFESLLTRAAAVPTERTERLNDALDLVSGRVMDYSSSDATWWRWTEIAFGATDWTARTTDVAGSLARCRLDDSEPAAARDIAERGLVADPLNASLTELLMEAYADLGTLESAQRVYESHDRSLDRADLGGASIETRRVLDRLRSAANGSGIEASATA
ncbi:BTAD domain-containing putative transcriptional regulator, partial [Ilumatobacter sp.]|uniref:AfsR/SARP family transcriptional regulator n=1 Tax=Ilumatobacter sp. TaxID=1967498 RepID=UPI003750D2F2